MVGYGRQLQGLAIALSSLAGFIDALGFITLGGVFVSFMSGNSTRFAVGTADGAWQTVALIGGVLALFVLGVILGSVVAELTDRDRRTRKIAVLATVTVLLTVAAAAVLVDWTPVSVIAMTLAMGTENSVFRRHGETTVALTGHPENRDRYHVAVRDHGPMIVERAALAALALQVPATTALSSTPRTAGALRRRPVAPWVLAAIPVIALILLILLL